MPRKTAPAQQQEAINGEASMRPRPDAAENLWLLGEGQEIGYLASMRPRPDAAENLRREDAKRIDAVELQ